MVRWILRALVAILVLASCLIVLLAIFPNSIKPLVESRLSQIFRNDVFIEEISWHLKEDNLVITVDKIDLNNQRNFSIVTAENIALRVPTDTSWASKKIVSNLSIEQLRLRSDRRTKPRPFSVHKLSNPAWLKIFNLQSLNVQKTTVEIQNRGAFYIGAIEAINQNDFLNINIKQQSPQFIPAHQSKNLLNLKANVPLSQLRQWPLILPFKVLGDGLNFDARLRLEGIEEETLLSVEGEVTHIVTSQLPDLLPPQYFSEKTRASIGRILTKGVLENIRFSLSRPLFKKISFDKRLSAQIKGSEISLESGLKFSDVSGMVAIKNRNLNFAMKDGKWQEIPLPGTNVVMSDIRTGGFDISLTSHFRVPTSRLFEILNIHSQTYNKPFLDKTLKALSPEGETEVDGSFEFKTTVNTKNQDKPIGNLKLKLGEHHLISRGGTIEVSALNAIYEDRQLSLNASGNFQDENYQLLASGYGSSPEELLRNIAFSLVGEETGGNRVHVEPIAGVWKVSVDTPSFAISGGLAMPHGHLEININHLVRKENPKRRKKRSSLWTFPIKEFPERVDVSISGIQLGSWKVPQMSFVLRSFDQRVTLEDAFINGEAASNSFTFNGAWIRIPNSDDAEDYITRIKVLGEADTLGQLLAKLGVDEDTEKGAYQIMIELWCPCHPSQISTPRLHGRVDLTIGAGTLTGVKPLDVSRIISLFNLKTLSEQLQKEESTPQGFTFDNIKLNAEIKRGIVNFERFNIESDSVELSVLGNTNLVARTHNLDASAKLELADSIPLASYLAGGGLTGLGFWLFDKVFFAGQGIDTVVEKITNLDYSITGNWKDPKVRQKTHATKNIIPSNREDTEGN